MHKNTLECTILKRKNFQVFFKHALNFTVFTSVKKGTVLPEKNYLRSEYLSISMFVLALQKRMDYDNNDRDYIQGMIKMT